MRRHSRLLRAYQRGFHRAREEMRPDLEAMRASLEHELRSLRAAVAELRIEYIRAQGIERAVGAEPNGPWLQ
jgi:hypothetical protein